MKLLAISRNYFLGILLPLLAIWLTLLFYTLKSELNSLDDSLLNNRKEAFFKRIQDNPNFELPESSINAGILIEEIDIATYSRFLEVYENRALLNPTFNLEQTYRVLTTKYRSKENNRFYLISFVQPQKNSNEILFLLIRTALFFLIGLAIILWLVQKVSFKRIWHPFYKSLEEINTFDIQQHQPLSAKKTGIFEFDQLNDALEKLTSMASKSYFAQKHFVENTSHELQTPLAVMQNKIELALQNPNLNEESAKILIELTQSIQKLSKLNKALLLLTRLENNTYVEKSKIQLAPVCREILNAFEEKIESKKLKVVQNFKQGVTITGNKMIIEVLLTNLIKNAVYHNVNNGLLEISTVQGHLRIRNNLKENAVNGADARRYQANPENQNSTGLGLSIVRKICEINGFDYSIGTDNQLFSFQLSWESKIPTNSSFMFAI